MSICDGVQSADVWLGRPAFLPRIVADTSELSIVPEPGNLSGPLSISDDGSQRLQAGSPVDGAYVVSSKVARGQLTPWSRRISFVRDAVPHNAYGGAKDDLLPLRDWTALEEQALTSHVSHGLEWTKEAVRLAIFLRLFTLVDARAGMSWTSLKWFVLASLRPSTLGPCCGVFTTRDFFVHVATTLGRTRVVASASLSFIRKRKEGDIVLAQGALCHVLTDEFERAVEGGGGKLFRRAAASVWGSADDRLYRCQPSVPVRKAWMAGCSREGDSPTCFFRGRNDPETERTLPISVAMELGTASLHCSRPL